MAIDSSYAISAITGKDGQSGASLSVQYSVDGTSNWHDTFASGDIYMRQKLGNGSWSDAMKIVGEDGKNAITMTSATTPSGEYEGQIGFWQGQPYMWNGSSWVKQIGDLPTDAVLHYSFDEVPDYPDGSADVRLLDNTYDIQTTNYYFYNNGGASFSNVNGNLQIGMSSNGANTSINNTLIANKIVKIKIKIVAIDGVIKLFTNPSTGIDMSAIGEYEYTWNNTTNNRCILYCNSGNSATVEISKIYIGDGSYSTPIIDNANGQNNAVNNGGIATKGVSGKGAYFLNGKSANLGVFNLPSDFSISVWVKPDNNTNSKQGDIIFKSTYFYIRNGDSGNNNYVLIAIYNKTTSSYSYIRGSQSLLPPQKYSHLVLTKNANVVKAYLDGVLERTVELTFTELNDNANNFTLGQSSNTRPQSIDDLLIFDRALSETEVQALYQNKANTPKYYDLSDYIVEGIDDDGIISPSEKEILYQKWIDIYAVLNGTAITASSTGQGGEYGKMISRATTAGVSLVTTGGEGKAYVDATEALRAGLWTTAYLQNMSVQTKVSAGTIDTLFNNYRTAYEALSIAIDVQNKATASALSISQSNSYHQVPTNSSGTPLSYVGTDNTVYLLEGSSKLTCVATGTTLTAGKWKITNITMTGCTSGTTKDNYTIDSNGAVLGVLTGMTEQSAKRTLTIQFMGNNASTAETITVVQSFAKSQAGADGSTYKLLASANCVKTNTSVRFDAKKIVGESVSSYADGYLYSSTDGTTWTAKGQFKNGSAYASKNITVSVDTIFRLCLTESPSTNLVDELSVNIFRDGVDGQDGHSPTVTATKSGTQTTIKVDDVTQAVINDGTNGTNGTNTWYSSASATSSTTSIALNTITSVTGHTVAVGDLIIANGLVFYISAVSSTNATVVYKEKIKGDTGGTGNFTKRIPLYYVSTSTTAPSAPSSRVTSTSTATTTTWTQGIYNTYAVGKYYYTCEQIEVYNNAGTYQSCSWSAVSRHTEYENACVAKLRSAGQYIGTKSASFTAYTGSSNWDWFLATANFTQQSVSIVAGNVYVWNGSTWVRDTDTSHLSASMKDMMALVDSYTSGSTDIATYATVLAKTLAVQQAFIDELMANTIIVGNEIKSDNYTSGSSGFSIKADGSVEFDSGTFRGIISTLKATSTNRHIEIANTNNENKKEFIFAVSTGMPYLLGIFNLSYHYSSSGGQVDKYTLADGIAFFDSFSLSHGENSDTVIVEDAYYNFDLYTIRLY